MTLIDYMDSRPFNWNCVARIQLGSRFFSLQLFIMTNTTENNYLNIYRMLLGTMKMIRFVRSDNRFFKQESFS